jgi:hypothetical protein
MSSTGYTLGMMSIDTMALIVMAGNERESTKLSSLEKDLKRDHQLKN